ncbi:hypothetical protein GCM10010513_73770 [Streptomyces glebosus]|nr:hypothetical protein GCM10010513_73770 [Streptomyces glebosus]
MKVPVTAARLGLRPAPWYRNASALPARRTRRRPVEAGGQLHQTRKVLGNARSAFNSAAGSGAATSIRCPSTSGAEL